MMRSLLFWFACFTVYAASAQAVVQEAYSVASNDNIKELVYNPNAVHRYLGFYNYQSSIVFEADEVIDTISVGASEGWQFVHQANRLFLKPIKNNADTNATILTNKRIYHFIFEAAEADGIEDPRIAYEVRFRYPSKLFDVNYGVNEAVDLESLSGGEFPEIDDAENLNFNYTIAGSDNIKPVKIFDNGKFTYMQFPKLSVDLPAVFAVESDGYEALVNLRMIRMMGNDGDFLALEHVGSRFTLRSGSDVVCVRNENIPFEYHPDISNRIPFLG